MKPTPEQARAFALMLQAGLPAGEAIVYFAPEGSDPMDLKHMLQGWQLSAEVKRATLALMGKPWQEMSLEEKIHYALDIHYAALAHFLYANNYSDLGPQDRAKADVARTALEAKLAGTAGKVDALSQFFADIKEGKLKMGRPAGIGVLPA